MIAYETNRDRWHQCKLVLLASVAAFLLLVGLPLASAQTQTLNVVLSPAASITTPASVSLSSSGTTFGNFISQSSRVYSNHRAEDCERECDLRLQRSIGGNRLFRHADAQHHRDNSGRYFWRCLLHRHWVYGDQPAIGSASIYIGK